MRESLENPSRKRHSQFREICRRFRKSKAGMIGLVIVALLVLTALFVGLFVPYTAATKVNASIRLQDCSAEHPFGTDAFGRDIFARVLYGTRYSLAIGVCATLIALVFGGLLGLIAGYAGGTLDNIIMRATDILVSIPSILLSMVVVASFGAGAVNLTIALAVGQIANFTRMIRSATMSIIDNEYIDAARAGGASGLYIICKHIVNNVSGTIIVQTTMTVSRMILSAAGLSFLGLGVPPPAPEWGAMLNEAQEYMRVCFNMMLFPGLAICLSALSLNLFGDGLRDALDPKLKN